MTPQALNDFLNIMLVGMFGVILVSSVAGLLAWLLYYRKHK